jgi:hypothetical protein
MCDRDERPEQPVPEIELLPEFEHPNWPQAEIEARMDEEVTHGNEPHRAGGPLEVMRARLLKIIAQSRASKPQHYGFVLTWGLVPEHLDDLEAGDDTWEMRPAFHVLTAGGEFLPLTKSLMVALHGQMTRVNGTSLLFDMEPALDTWSTSPGIPVTALDCMYVCFIDPMADTDHASSHTLRSHITARKMDQDIYLTLEHRPTSWPA